jgi:hypothetical protein
MAMGAGIVPPSAEGSAELPRLGRALPLEGTKPVRRIEGTPEWGCGKRRDRGIVPTPHLGRRVQTVPVSLVSSESHALGCSLTSWSLGSGPDSTG